ncbi:MAG: hypothetical protein HFI33_13355 [Lachnospiraceae bacterium]|nr:hypothetical protein [Lachnospiraceae bacterium]
MTLQNTIAKLVRYCGQYQSHGFMMDERNTDVTFHVELPEERKIRDSMESLRVILLTGEAGDGKTRMMRNLEPLFTKHGFSQIHTDFSALKEKEKEALIRQLRSVLDGEGQEKLVISANVGIFTQAVIRYDMALMGELTKERKDVHICNFENRNLAEDKEAFAQIVKSFLTDGKSEKEYLTCTKTDCPCYGDCAYDINMKKILSEVGTEAVRVLCNAIYLTGGHITFRELLSLLSYLITFGQDCEERQAYLERGGSQERVLYYQVFEKSRDALLHKVAVMDPALKRGEYSPRKIKTKEEYIRYRRWLFFEEGQDYFAMLHVDYLVEFYQVLEYMNQPPFHYDTIKDRNATLQCLKRGINKMSSQGKSDGGLVVTDTPMILGNQIRLEFMVMQDLSMIWHRYDIQPGKKYGRSSRLWNKFYLSYVSKKDRKFISLLVDYRQFRYLMLCNDDYFLNRNELTMEEYAVNTFYRKILQERGEAYESVIVRFEEKTREQCDFSLLVHESEDIFSDEKSQSIRIRRED